MSSMIRSSRGARLFSLILWVLLLIFGYANWVRDDGGQKTYRSSSADCESGSSSSSEVELNLNSSKRLVEQRITVSTFGPGDGCHLKGQELKAWTVRRSTASRRVYYRQDLGRVKVQQIVRSTYARLGEGQRQFVERKFGSMARVQTYDLLTLKALELRDSKGPIGSRREFHPYVEREEVNDWARLNSEPVSDDDKKIEISTDDSLRSLVSLGLLEFQQLQQFLSLVHRNQVVLDPGEFLRSVSSAEMSRSQPSKSSISPRFRLVIASRAAAELVAYNLISVLGELHPEMKIVWKREAPEGAGSGQ